MILTLYDNLNCEIVGIIDEACGKATHTKCWITTSRHCRLTPHEHVICNVTHLSLPQEAKSKPRHEGETAATAREFDGTYNVQPKVYGTYAAEQYGKDHGGPPQHEGHEHGGPPMGRYSKFDYDPHEEERDLRGPYGGYPSREEYSRPPPRDTHIPEGDYSLPPSRDYPPLPGVRSRGMEEEERWRRRESTPPRVPARDFPPSGPPYGGTDYPPMRVRPPSHPDDYRGPPEQGESYYHRPPPPEPKRSAGIYTQMESIDYSHGGASNVYVKSVDYHHGTQPGGGYSSVPREMPPGVANFPYGSGGGYSAYGEGAAPGSYLPFGSPGGYTSGSGLDPAAIFAAYQGGKQKTPTCTICLHVKACGHLVVVCTCTLPSQKLQTQNCSVCTIYTNRVHCMCVIWCNQSPTYTCTGMSIQRM